MYRALDADKIIATIDLLQRRIDERFPALDLAAVAGDLSAAARDTEAKAKALARPHILIQLAVSLVIVAFIGLIIFALLNIPAPTNTEATNIVQTLEAIANLAVLAGALLLFLVTLQKRIKRHEALKALHQLRSLVHVIDMHGPMAGLRHRHQSLHPRTSFELSQILSYCVTLGNVLYNDG